MEKLKELFRPERVRAIADAISRAYPAFPQNEFLSEVVPQLAALELKGRMQLIARSLASHLPKGPQKSFPILLRSIRSAKNPQGLEGFQAWPLTQFVEDQGIDHPELSLTTLKELTKVMSAEFAIRPFLQHHRSLSLRALAKWATDENVHVRRLASEGSRPRLPWGQRLVDFQRDPNLCLGILRLLRLDPELYVRKSVANHLNDFSKDHPDWLVKELAAWKREFPDNKDIAWIIRHSCRSLIKAGHPGALALIGIKSANIQKPSLKLDPATVKLGGTLKITFTATGGKKEPWLIDYAIHHRKSNGELKPKVFKWTRKDTKAGEKISLQKSHRIVPISTRKYYSGKHEVEILVNGKPAARKPFRLET